MGRLTPQDIKDQEFKQSPLGYSKDQVNDFLEKIADELETLIRESNEIHLENKEARLALTTYRNVEDRLKETLLLAQKTAQETLKNAQKRSRYHHPKSQYGKRGFALCCQPGYYSDSE